MASPSQTQTGIGNLIAGIAGGYGNRQDAAAKQAYVQALYGQKAGLARDLQESKGEVAETVADTNAKGRVDAAHARKPAGNGTPLHFNADEAQRAALQAFNDAAFGKGGHGEYGGLAPELAEAGNAAYRGAYSASAKAHNAGQTARGYAPDASEDIGDYVTKGADTPGKWYGTNPGTYAVRPKAAGAGAAPAKETPAQRALRLAGG